MPYIQQSEREKLDKEIERIIYALNLVGWSSGNITYIIYKIILEYFKLEERYDRICSIRGILLGVFDEFNRREAHPYEDSKIKMNGDV